MNVQAFFNRPDVQMDLSQLYADIASAQYAIIVASPWFTNKAIAEAICDADVLTEVYMLCPMFGSTGDQLMEYMAERAIPRQRTARPITLWVMSSEWKSGLMHHKFIVIDGRITWAGSSNFTYQARRNFEHLIRIEDEGIASQFINECHALRDGYFRGWDKT